jgi:peptidoglycan/LPS O-acetylase OafA/YrhL
MSHGDRGRLNGHPFAKRKPDALSSDSISVNTVSNTGRSESTAAFEYMPQLDGLRAFAVAGVVAQHYKLEDVTAAHGVHLFFVLSGFLITGILMKGREHIASAGLKPAYVFRQFYARRALRIFPLYYLVLLIAVLVNADSAREYAPWLFTYTINLKMAVQGWYISNFAHFWSLAVEEQYYLVWPWLILLLPKRWLVPSAILMTAIGPLFRLVFVAIWSFTAGGPGYLPVYIATPTALDSLGLGSLVAIMMSTAEGREKLQRWMRSPLALIALGLVIALPYLAEDGWYIVFGDTAAAILFAWLIYRASKGFRGLPGRILSAAPLVFIGRISYGIYVYHPLVPAALRSLAPRLGIMLPASVGATAALFTALTVVVATISWYAFEAPINGLKRYFPYVPRDSLPQALPAPGDNR